MAENIFLYFKRETLEKMLSSFHSCTELPVRILDPEGNTELAYMGKATFCGTVQSFPSQLLVCRKMGTELCRDLNATQKSSVVTCPHGLSCLAIPFIRDSHYIFTILIGPFFLEAPDSYLAADMFSHSDLCMRDVLRLHEELKTIRVISETLLPSVGDLISFLFHLPGGQHSDSMGNQEISSVPIQDYMDSSAYPYETERLLISNIKSGNIQEANAVLNDLLGYVLFTKNGSLDTGKARAIELCCVLSRVAIENGATTSGVLNFNNECIKSIQTVEDIYALGDKLLEITEVFLSSIQRQQQKTRNELIQRAEDYIMCNYTRSMTLEGLAGYVHLNPSYFSSLFKQTTGTSFKSYLNMIRVENSKSLLTSAELTLMQAASAVGFQDYNYFSRVFKKQVGLTPSQYREQSRSCDNHH